ncbi:CsbD family protein [Aquabacterium sp.]|uniref:CsbD family protein n=1 Tax=Aquabacterium sp. TaxID=1872578 RepID=UPI002D064615|nr:CsbD family protein [Aquabacterium sp.]HSW05681.1 CsbD family protein [Aquabacterium sp.]
MNSPWYYLDTLPKGMPIAWDRVEGLCRQGLGKLVTRIGLLLRSERCAAAGRRAQLAGRVQRRYGVAMDEARRLILAYERQAQDPWYTAASARHAKPAPNPAAALSAKPRSPTEGLETK